ncbi:hypothetical protein BWI17_05770 [Betaproteobacteria bacterium GR16-43]|nr:hypothetical protein BWI17_05770 [Betaproteobacteria bacterium GR16-43]
MLITTCTHCLARFRVTPSQLNLKQGQVRCGHCQQVFSGFEALERFPDDDTGSRILAARAAGAAPHASPEAPARTPPEAHFHAIAPEALPEIADDALDDEPEPLRDRAPAARESASLRGPDSDALPVITPEPEPPRAPRLDDLLLDKRPATRERSPARDLIVDEFTAAERKPVPRAWIFGCVLLGLVMAVQLLYAFRAQVAQSYPITRPWLESACAHAGCRVPWVNDPQLLKLEDSELLEVPGRPGEIALGARIRNLATVSQEYPHLELTLTDLSGQAAARRVLRPTDYLGRAPESGDVMGAGSEIAIQLRLDTPRIKPTGYELLLFYP